LSFSGNIGKTSCTKKLTDNSWRRSYSLFKSRS